MRCNNFAAFSLEMNGRWTGGKIAISHHRRPGEERWKDRWLPSLKSVRPLLCPTKLKEARERTVLTKTANNAAFLFAAWSGRSFCSPTTQG